MSVFNYISLQLSAFIVMCTNRDNIAMLYVFSALDKANQITMSLEFTMLLWGMVEIY